MLFFFFTLEEKSMRSKVKDVMIRTIIMKGEPELTDTFNLLINVKLRMLWNWNFFYLNEEHFYGNIVS